MKLYLFALLGVLLHIAVKLRNEYTEKREAGKKMKEVFKEFDFVYHGYNSLIGYVCLCVLIGFRESLFGFLNMDEGLLEYMAPFVFFAGYFIDSFWKNIEGIAKKRIIKD